MTMQDRDDAALLRPFGWFVHQFSKRTGRRLRQLEEAMAAATSAIQQHATTCKLDGKIDQELQQRRRATATSFEGRIDELERVVRSAALTMAEDSTDLGISIRKFRDRLAAVVQETRQMISNEVLCARRKEDELSDRLERIEQHASVMETRVAAMEGGALTGAYKKRRKR